MKKPVSLLSVLITTLLCIASGSPSYAQATFFVSVTGSDLNACTIAAPCRTVTHAAGTIGNGGTVSCLDAGPYTGSVGGLNYSVVIDCRGVVGGGSIPFTNIQTGAVVTFRNVIFDGSAGANSAVQIFGGKVVFENCVFQNFMGQAIQFAPNAAGAHLTISNSILTNNGNGATGGAVVVQPTGGNLATAVIERTQIDGNTNGVVANASGGPVLVDIRYTTISKSALDGIQSISMGPTASVVLEHSASLHNSGNGTKAVSSNAYVSLNDSIVAWNATGLTASGGGVILTYKNNIIAGNPNPGSTPLSFSQQ